MTNPQDPFWNNPFTYDPLGRVPYGPPMPPPLGAPMGPPMGPPPGPPTFPPPPPPLPYRPRVNTFATLSLVFAFVFAPVGAVLGHVGLAQIRRTGEIGRHRALVGVSLSYAFIVLAVVALAGWATLPGATRSRTATPATSAPVTTSETPPPPTVAPDAIIKLLPGLETLKTLTGDQNLEPGQTFDRPGKSDKDGSVDRPECWGSIVPGAPEAYSTDAMLRYRAEAYSDTRTLLKSIQVTQAVIGFRDPPTAQAQETKLVDGWRTCGSVPVTLTAPGGPTYSLTLSPPADAGNGISTMDLAPKGLQVRFVRAAAAKANVVVDLYVAQLGTTDTAGARQSAVAIANYVLNKIPD
ncbi:sensor domain-containing protein [Mycobacterium shigaense]|uniref:sensor domain-containing protein n=1 Tax=Mycobacterium shigaense TaxID=722731 RepID=UPI000E5769CA|nr:sensor domain-containing protein [Mycobacterium shigaense]MEA1122039.1 sensor domain-containing protein [Mycobacterium shigaense]